MTEKMVLTPGGYRAESKVRFIEPKHRLKRSNGHLKKMDPTGAEIADFGVLEERVQGLPIMPRQVSRLKPRIPAMGSGWIAYADWTNTTGNPISKFATRWTVPSPPKTSSGQTIFLFNGMEDSTMIYQPVLQWGVSAAGGGDYWAVASWYVDGQGGPAHFSQLTKVNPGDVVVGTMTLTGQSPQGFSYECLFDGLPDSSLVIEDVPELIWCIETLEAYGITAPSDYPAVDVTSFDSIELVSGAAPANHPQVMWTAVDAVTDIGQHANVVSNDNPGGTVDIFYHDEAAPGSVALLAAAQDLGAADTSATAGFSRFWQKDNDAKRVGVAMLLVMIFGCIVAMFASPKYTTASALLWAGACSAIGWVLGFLFGIPRSLSSDTARTGVTDVQGSSTLQNAIHGGSTAVNTNLEQISDWLTKIIVGVTLVEIRPAIANLEQAAKVIAGALGGDTQVSLAYSIMLYFSASGFLGSYLLTRLFLQRAFNKADAGDIGARTSDSAAQTPS